MSERDGPERGQTRSGEETAFACNHTHNGKYAVLSVSVSASACISVMSEPTGFNQTGSTSFKPTSDGYGDATLQDPLYTHFDLFPDTSDHPGGVTDLELLTGRPAWLYSHRESHGSESEDRPGNREAPLNQSGFTGRGSASRQPVPSNEAQARNEEALNSRSAPGQVASRWFGLKRIFNQDDDRDEVPLARVPDQHVPSLAVFSLAGGVGKTSLVATLGRTLSAYGERVLMVDTTDLELLPFYFGARELPPRSSGVVRTFTAAGSTDAAVSMVSIRSQQPDPQLSQQVSNHTVHGNLAGGLPLDEISRHARGTSRILVDVATSASDVARRLLNIAPTVLVPLTPDMNSVVSLSAVESLFSDQETGRSIQPHYLINQFDPALPLHLDVRELLRERLGDRLLPFVLRRNSVVSDALAQGMTVMDYAPNSNIAEDYMGLANWIRSVSAPAVPGYRGVRWTERPLDL